MGGKVPPSKRELPTSSLSGEGGAPATPTSCSREGRGETITQREEATPSPSGEEGGEGKEFKEERNGDCLCEKHKKQHNPHPGKQGRGDEGLDISRLLGVSE